MKGTFRKGDCLILEITDSYHRGDIIIFRQKESDHGKELVHRIRKITDSFIITRGDNNCSDDPPLQDLKRISGKVTQVIRNGQRKKIRGGFPGRVAMRMNRLGIYIKQGIRIPLVFLIHLISHSKILSNLWNPVHMKAWFLLNIGMVQKYFRHGRVIATWYPETNRFACKIWYLPFFRKPDTSPGELKKIRASYFLSMEYSDFGTQDNSLDDS